MRVNFNLKQTVNENLPTQLMMAMTIQKKRIRVYTKIRVCPCEWDKRNKCCILLSHLPLRRTRELQLMNKRIRWMEEQVHRAYDNEMTNNVYYNKVHTHAQCSVSEKIYLKEEEIERIRHVPTSCKAESEVRDLFVVAIEIP